MIRLYDIPNNTFESEDSDSDESSSEESSSSEEEEHEDDAIHAADLVEHEDGNFQSQFYGRHRFLLLNPFRTAGIVLNI